MITGLDHIAIAVPDLEAAIQRFMADFGLEYEGTEEVEAAKTSTAFFPLPPPVLSWSIRFVARAPLRNTSKSGEAVFIISVLGLMTLMPT